MKGALATQANLLILREKKKLVVEVVDYKRFNVCTKGLTSDRICARNLFVPLNY